MIGGGDGYKVIGIDGGVVVIDYDRVVRVDWTVAVELDDDRDVLYEGNLEVEMDDGEVKFAYLDWVRSGTDHCWSDPDLSVRVEELRDYEECYGEIAFVCMVGID